MKYVILVLLLTTCSSTEKVEPVEQTPWEMCEWLLHTEGWTNCMMAYS